MLAQAEERFDGPLTITRTRYGDDVIVFAFAGELDLAATTLAWQALEPALDEPRAMIVLDLTELEFIGVKGIALLYGLARARPDEERLRLLPSRHPGVNRVLELTEVDSVLTIVGSRQIGPLVA
jgi:anti-anti-sigma factor